MSGNVLEEQAFVQRAATLLDDHIDYLKARVEQIKSAPGTGTGQDELEREAHLDNLHQQLSAALAARKRVCFGRLRFTTGDDDHVGRIGLRGPDGEVVLLDWRAPHASPFYQATLQDPMGLALRRRIASRSTPSGPEVTHVDDEEFTGHYTEIDDFQAARTALEAPREGRMGDILATIAADQDAVIRSPLEQVTVVEGGPGTGKTVVALHRAAWLLYTYRERLARDGVLIIGPSNVFLQYIDQVLPSLGETDVVLLTPSQFYPAIRPSVDDPPAIARVKGDARMAKVVAAAIAARVRLPDTGLSFRTTTGGFVQVSSEQLHQATKGISRSRNFHEGRDPFLRRVLASAAQNIARDRGRDPSDDEYCLDIIASLVEDANVRRELNLMWLPTTPEQVISRLLTDPDFLYQAATGVLSTHEQQLLLRSADSPWATDDIPLLDEAAHALGPWSPPAPQESSDPGYRELQAEDAYRISSSRDVRGHSSLAERAIDDREWIYGHVIVDEAQELSAMAWRAVARRATRRSMTVVGDLQQASHPSAAREWNEALFWAADRVKRFTLTVTYRITRQIARAATELLLAAGGDPPELTPIRDGPDVRRTQMTVAQLARYALEVSDPDGRSAVIVPDVLFPVIRQALQGPDFGFEDYALDAPIAVLTAQQSKGLEFDCVLLVDPAAIGVQRPRGADVYVAATRATKDLHMVDIVE